MIKVTADGIVREFDNMRDMLAFVEHLCLNCHCRLSKLAGAFCRECYRSLNKSDKDLMMATMRGKIVGTVIETVRTEEK